MKLTKKQQKLHRAFHKFCTHVFVTAPFAAIGIYMTFIWNPDDVFNGAPVKQTGADWSFLTVAWVVLFIFIFLFNYATHHRFVNEDHRRRSEGRYKYNPKTGRTRELTGNEKL